MSTVITAQQLNFYSSNLRLDAEEIVEAKRGVYTQGLDDTTRNFKLIASLTGMTVGQVMAVYLAKQVVSIMGMMTNPLIVDGEADTRFPDTLNYLELCNALVKEGAQHERP